MNYSRPGLTRRSFFGIVLPATLLIGTLSHSSLADGPRWTSVKNRTVLKKDDLLRRVEEAISVSERRILSGDVHTPWQIMHGILALRMDYEIRIDNKLVNAWKWIKSNPKYEGEHWFQKTRYGGRAHPYSKPFAFEGHPNQFLAIMAVAKLPIDSKIETPKGAITIRDIVKHTQAVVSSQEECAWTLWGLSHYLPLDSEWENKYGEHWSLEKLVKVELNQDFHGAACGGTHVVFGLSSALNAYRKAGKPLRGVWLEVDQKIKQFVQLAKANQNKDGTFSTDFFRSKKHSPDFEERLATSGHVLEFLMVALSDEQLQEKWVRRGVDAMARDLIVFSDKAAECSALYHALDGLVIYRNRIHAKSLAQKIAMQKIAMQKIAMQKITMERKILTQPTIQPIRAEKPISAQKKATEDIKTMLPLVAPRPKIGHHFAETKKASVTKIVRGKEAEKKE